MGIASDRRFWVTAGVALLTGCAPAVRSQRDEAIAVPQGATWAWEAPDSAGSAAAGEREAPDRPPRGAMPRAGDRSGATAIPRQRFHRALEAALEARGFHRADDPAHADFVLSLAFDAPGRAGPGVRTGVAIGVGGGFGGRGRGGPGWGWYRPWVGYGPGWGWAWQPWGFGWYGMPMWGMAGTRGVTIVALLRVPASGDVAWRAQYRADAYDLAYLTQGHARQIADRLVATLQR